MKIPATYLFILLSNFRDSGIFMECAHLFIRGEQQQHEEKLEAQYDHIDRYLELINEHNPTVLPALVEPKQLLSLKESSDGITSGGVSEAREVLRYLKEVFLSAMSLRRTSMD